MELERTITSVDVAEMVGREHRSVLRDIRKIISHIKTSENKNVRTYFIESSYPDLQDKDRPCYLLTKKGCELYSNRMTGERGTHFSMAYIDRFDQMEHYIKNEPSQLSSTKVQLKALLEHEEKLERLEGDVSELKNEIDLTRIQKKRLSDIVRRNAMEAVGGKKSEAYKPYYKIAIAENWRSIKNYFEVASYEEIPRLKFDEAVELAKNWSPSAELKMNIKKCLQQLALM